MCCCKNAKYALEGGFSRGVEGFDCNESYELGSLIRSASTFIGNDTVIITENIHAQSHCAKWVNFPQNKMGKETHKAI